MPPERSGYSTAAVVAAAVVGFAAALSMTTLVGGAAPAKRSPSRPRSSPGVRLTMAALHQQGGVPLGWRLTVPPGDVAAGRAAFDRLGCPACHRVAGETFANALPEPKGPELTGMGSHHPPAYFAEAILDPDAVLIDEPGYVDADGHSTMPTYDELTLGELADVVAYLASLRAGDAPSCHAGGAAPSGASGAALGLARPDRPVPSASAAHVFFAQSYDVEPGRLAEYEAWFARRGREGFLAGQGVVSVDTYVAAASPTGAVTTVVGLRDDAALRTFLADPAMADLWNELDAFVGPHGHVIADAPLVYRVPALSGD